MPSVPGSSAPAATSTTWSDEFSGPAGTRPDPLKWAYDVGGRGWGNRELETYTSSAANAQLDGQGHLVLTAADPAYAETDIMEHVGNEPRASYSSQHGTRGCASMSNCVDYVLPGGAAYSDAPFFVFSVDWTAAAVAFSVAGHLTATRRKASSGRAWTFDQPMFLILDLAVGGVWAGTPPPATVFPTQLLVDYVRVSATPSTAAAHAPGPSTTAGGCDRAT